ncbi:MAG: glutamine--fructose-6-phosphate transaminase (isomerizing) [Bacteroidetes bacterium]|nr:MAG: glutamine--fructose-6-phosphate transaminase (isomerizing) [Bacteroidota bacterium]TAG87665.1 MAG: glutamine--fructose-6-phosphate transaminase (isomerizing) [Bacteroidota bacterium]
MCGIVGYTGHKNAYPIIIGGLERLEYRGYDSAGIALLNGDLNVYKKKGKVDDLKKSLTHAKLDGNTGIGHTRWATHGEPNDINAHPHYSNNKDLVIVHNGIIENYNAIKQDLINKGYQFESQTDTEVLVSFIEDIQKNTQASLEESVRFALQKVIGAYAIVVMSKNSPQTLIAARKGSPLVIGVGKDEGEYFIASDATPIIEYTNEVIYLDDLEIAVIRDGNLTIKNLDSTIKTPYIHTLEMSLEAIEKGGYPYFMLKEIFEQPKSVTNSLRGRVNADEGTLTLGGLSEYMNRLLTADRIIILGCGTSWHAGLVAEYLFEEYARIPVEVEYASEFRYRNPIIKENDVIIAISQSGETADTLAAIELAKSKGAKIFGVCNVVGASIPRMTDAGVYIHAGPEIGVASTKAFTGQLSVLTMMALMIAHKKGIIAESEFREILTELELIPQKIQKALEVSDKIEKIASKFKDATNFLYLGRGNNFPVALEGALKLKEISYIHAEGYPAAEMKHGPIALIDKEMPVVFIAPQDGIYEKIVSNIQEVKARAGKVIAIVTEGEKNIKEMADYTIEIPATHQMLTPLLSVIPLQLLSYYIAIMRGCDVDKPRNLAKSVTVE